MQSLSIPNPASDPTRSVTALLGIDHEKLTYRHAGRDCRLTDVEGHVVKEILA